MKPSTTIEATATGLHWNVVVDGETVGTGRADSMKNAQAAADEFAKQIGQRLIDRPQGSSV